MNYGNHDDFVDHDIDENLLAHCTNETTVAWLMNLSGLSENRINTFINNSQNEELIHINGRRIQKKD